jgi:hypothetical protein
MADCSDDAHPAAERAIPMALKTNFRPGAAGRVGLDGNMKTPYTPLLCQRIEPLPHFMKNSLPHMLAIRRKP